MGNNTLNLPSGSYLLQGAGGHTNRYVDEWNAVIPGTRISLYKSDTKERVARVWTPLNILRCGNNRCGDLSRCPVHTNMNSLKDGVTLDIVDDGDAYFSQWGQRVCDVDCDANRETCGLNLVVLEP